MPTDFAGIEATKKVTEIAARGRLPAVAALIVAIAACGAPLRPDHGNYITTGAESRPVKHFQYPRAKRLVIASPSTRFQCVHEWAEHDLRGKGILLAAVPFVRDQGFVAARLIQPGTLSADERATLDGALVLAIVVESIEGPSGGWNPFSGAITSAHQRTDIGLALYEPDSAVVLWRAESRVRTALNCPDQELGAQLQQMLDNIK